MSLDGWIKNLPENDRDSVKETISQLWAIFVELQKQGYLKENLESEVRNCFVRILETSNGLFDAFNMFFGISDLGGKFVQGRNKEFVEHNKEYGFTDSRFVNLLLSESLSVFLRTVELFRCCFLVVLKTKERKVAKKENYPFYSTMTLGILLNQLESVCGENGKKIGNKIKVDLRNGLTHGLFWIEKLDVVYSKDITFDQTKRKQIKLDAFWKEAFDQSLITQCLIEMIPEWYEKSKIWKV